MKRFLMILMALLLIAIGLIGTSGVVSADAPDVVGPGDGTTPFLCPAVSIDNPNAHPLGTSGYGTFLPGHNQAGAHANYHAWNGVSASESQGPVLDEYWSPIWPSDQPQP